MTSEENTSPPSKPSLNLFNCVALLLSSIAIAIGVFNFYCLKSNKIISTRVLSNVTQQETLSLQALQQKLDVLQRTQQTLAQNNVHDAPNPSTEKTFSDITMLAQQIQQLPSVPAIPPTVIKNPVESNVPTTQPLNWHQRIVKKIKSLKNLFVIRRIDQANTSLINPAQEMMVKQNSVMQLNMAQWGLLRHDTVIYQTALNTVSRWISQYFLPSDARKIVLNRLTTLAALSIAAPVVVPSDEASNSPNTVTPASAPKSSTPKPDNLSSSVET